MQNITSIAKKLAFAFILSFLCACSTNKAWVYKANDYDQNNKNNAALRSKSLVVTAFSDKRSGDNENNLMLYLIPLMPFGYQDLSVPEGIPMHVNSGLWTNYNPKEDFAKALAEEISATGLFKEAFFANSTKDSDYYISGEVVSTKYTSKMLSYGLSVYGPALWYVGFPASFTSNDLEIKLSFVETKSKKVVFSRVYKADQYSKVGWIYKLANDFNYSEMLSGIYKKFVQDLTKEAKSL